MFAMKMVCENTSAVADACHNTVTANTNIDDHRQITQWLRIDPL